MHLSIVLCIFLNTCRKGAFLFYKQFLKLCEKSGVKPTSLLTSLGMSKGSIANWKNGKLPSGEVLVRFSEHFGVSLDYLVYGKENSKSQLSESDAEWIYLIHQLPHDAQLEFKGELKGYLKRLEQEYDGELKQAK